MLSPGPSLIVLPDVDLSGPQSASAVYYSRLLHNDVYNLVTVLTFFLSRNLALREFIESILTESSGISWTEKISRFPVDN